MRPNVLTPLFASLTSLPGVGPKLEKLYAKLLDREIPRVIDLLFHLPSGAIDRRARPKLNEVLPDQVVTVAVQVEEHRPPPRNRPRAPYRIVTSDDTGVTLTLTYFSARPDYLEKLLPVGETRYVSGTAEFYDGSLQMGSASGTRTFPGAPAADKEIPPDTAIMGPCSRQLVCRLNFPPADASVAGPTPPRRG